MKKIALIAAFSAIAPAAAFANDCPFGEVWSSSQQACVTWRNGTAEMVQDSGQGWWIQPATDAMAGIIREGSTCEGCVVSE